MLNIALRSRHDMMPLLRQTDDGHGRHKETQIHTGPFDDADWLVVFDDIAVAETTSVPKERRILLVTEPPGIKPQAPDFINQFGIAVSPFDLHGFTGRWIESQSALPWFYGSPLIDGRFVPRLTLAELKSMPVRANKQPRLSVVCSTKSKLPRHRERLVLIEALQAALPGAIDVFGSGFQMIPDKADAIDPYRYHLVLENNDIPHFWTEKLADPYLGFALPIFSGCANVTDYFAADSLVRLGDIGDHASAITTIRDLLARDPWDQHLDAIRRARTKLMEDYNLFSLIAGIVAAHPGTPQPRLTVQATLQPPPRVFRGTFGPARKAIHALKTKLRATAKDWTA
jgi:Glycosyltransferase family 10 (fucosyltransferase) C-term